MNEDKKGVFCRDQGQGFDVKILKEIIRLRNEDQNKRDEHDTLLNPCLHAIDTPASASTGCRVISAIGWQMAQRTPEVEIIEAFEFYGGREARANFSSLGFREVFEDATKAAHACPAAVRR
jgi:hypothetical protein